MVMRGVRFCFSIRSFFSDNQTIAIAGQGAVAWNDWKISAEMKKITAEIISISAEIFSISAEIIFISAEIFSISAEIFFTFGLFAPFSALFSKNAPDFSCC
jgi:hypothetical protein